jgi:hypothetical protein
LIGILSKSTATISLIGFVVPFIPDGFGVSFEGEDVGSDSVEKPTVVANYDRAASEL